jgi:hypothetical protein
MPLTMMMNMVIKISCSQGPETHVRSYLDHDHGDANAADDEETTREN